MTERKVDGISPFSAMNIDQTESTINFSSSDSLSSPCPSSSYSTSSNSASSFCLFEAFLPELFPALQIFLTYEDSFYFYNACKYLFHEVKRRHLYFPLNLAKSADFCRNFSDGSFKNILLQKVANPHKQISLRLSDGILNLLAGSTLQNLIVHRITTINVALNNVPLFPRALFKKITMVEEMRNIYTDFKTFPALPALRHLTLFNCTALTDVTNLSHLRYLELNFCDNLRSVECLKEVPYFLIQKCHRIDDFHTLTKQCRLKVSRCPNLTSLHSFSNIRQVIINDCQNVKDFSPLSNTYDVTISNCDQFKDLSPLRGRHHRIAIWSCFYQLIDYDILQDVPHVSLEGCNISDLNVLRNAVSVMLQRCHKVEDVSPLAHVKKLHLGDCRNVVDINPLKDVPELTLGFLERVSEYSNLGNCRNTIVLQGTDRIDDFSFLPHIAHLSLRRMHYFQRVIDTHADYFRSLQSIFLDCCNGIRHVNGLGDVPTVILVSLPITDITGLGRNRYVRIVGCSELADVSSLCNVPRVTIFGCKLIPPQRILEVLHSVPRLRVA